MKTYVEHESQIISAPKKWTVLYILRILMLIAATCSGIIAIFMLLKPMLLKSIAINNFTIIAQIECAAFS